MSVPERGAGWTFPAGLLTELLVAILPYVLDAVKHLQLPGLSAQKATYEVLDCRVHLALEDSQGAFATYSKTERVRMLHSNIAFVPEFAWGDGDQFASHRAIHGRIIQRSAEGSRYRSVIQLTRRHHSGEIVRFTSRRSIKDGFRSNREWLEFDVMHKTKRLALLVSFPASRPPRRALVSFGSHESEELPVRNMRSHRTVLRYSVDGPRLGRYLIQWTW